LVCASAMGLNRAKAVTPPLAEAPPMGVVGAGRLAGQLSGRCQAVAGAIWRDLAAVLTAAAALVRTTAIRAGLVSSATSILFGIT